MKKERIIIFDEKKINVRFCLSWIDSIFPPNIKREYGETIVESLK